MALIKLIAATARDRARVGEIAGIAGRFGLGVLLARFGIASGGAAEAESDPLSLPRRTRLALEALGPTFIKIGQILAARGDLLAPEWIEEFEQLHSDAPTLAFADIRAAVEEALGEPPETAFADFDPVPLAAASMAQVHRATLHDGRAVVLKVRRPGIRPAMEADLRLIAELAEMAQRSSAEVRRLDPVALARQLSRAMLEELDFANEGRNADLLREDLRDNRKVVIPEIHWRWTSESLLVMDYVEGVKPLSGAALRDAGIDPQAIAEMGADLVLEMVLVNGRFHGDPHPGNLLCLPGDRLALLDLGMIGHVSPRRRDEFIGFVRSLVSGDPATLAGLLERWGREHHVSRASAQSAADQIVQRHGNGPLVMSAMVPDFLRLLREEGLVVPPDLLLIFKALVTMDGVLGRIAPDYDLSAAMHRAQTRLVMERFSPARLGSAAGALAWTLADLGEDAPRLIDALARRLEADPAPPAPTSAAGMGWIAAAVLGAGALIAAANLWVGFTP